MQLLIEALAQAIEVSARGSSGAELQSGLDITAVATHLEHTRVTLAGQTGSMRASDHQFQQPLVVGVMDRQGSVGVKFDVEGSGYGFRVIKTIPAAMAELPTNCRMLRP
jgi:branched-chain amino acid transport system substrate-binding protein